MDIHPYGILVDGNNKQVKCIFCGKIASSFSHLGFHLAGISGDVSSCLEAPHEVKELLRTGFLEKNKAHLTKEVENLNSPNLSNKRKLPIQSNNIEMDSVNIQGVVFGDQKRVKDDISTKLVTPIQRSTYLLAGGEGSSQVLSQEENAQKSISRFFYESGIDTTTAIWYSFQKMLNSFLAHGKIDKLTIPWESDFKGKFLQDEVQQMQQYVLKIRASWEFTGCSILLDGWTDENGRNLVNIIVECPQGPVYLKSVDIEGNALESCLDEVIADIGPKNVVQIITYSVSAQMKAIGKKLMEKYGSIFWTVSASHCIELMLEKILQIGMINTIMENVQTIIKFLHSHEAIVEILRIYVWGRNLVKPSLYKSAVPFLTLENILIEGENLRTMFSSIQWKSSEWANTTEGKKVYDLMNNPSFWQNAWSVSRGTGPIVRVLCLINEKDKIKMCTIYETMDQVKETIKKDVRGIDCLYLPIWNVIDEIWNAHLHSPLHAAGYFLNPCLVYSTSFLCDSEVVSGLLSCIMHMKRTGSVDFICGQVREYREGRGAFGEGRPNHILLNTCPVTWWITYGHECKELQELALTILGQTCNGGSKYRLKRTFAERMLRKGNDILQQVELDGMTFVHYNMHLRNVSSVSFDLSSSTEEEMYGQKDWY